jgi:AcrR family transcriptional regulator
MASDDGAPPRLEDGLDVTPSSVFTRGIARSLASKQEALLGEVNQIIAATYRVISRTGTIDPPLREILREAGLSTPAFYRHFRGKDELLVGLLEQGWVILGTYLSHQMDKVDDGDDKIEAWIRGMLAQAADPEAARRSKPFVANIYRLATAFPDEHTSSRNTLVQLLVEPLRQIRGDHPDPWQDAMTIYDLANAVQARHLLLGTSPSEQETEHLVTFVLNAVGAIAQLD